MNIIEALNQKRNLRLPIPKHMGSNGDGWLGHEYVLGLLIEGEQKAWGTLFGGRLIEREDFLSDKWEVQSSAGERLQDRISQMIQNTGLYPTILDVSEEDYREIERDIYSRGIPDKDRGRYEQLVVYMSHKGPTRIVKARK